MLNLNFSDIQNLVKGSTILATGGGFPPEKALASYQKLFRNGKRFELKSLDEFQDDDLAFSAYGVGSTEDTDLDVGKTVKLALNELQNYLQKEFKAIIPGEVGGEIGAFEVSAATGLPVLDGDLVGGRAAPDIEDDTFSIKGLPITPLAVASENGNSAIYTQTTSTKNVEDFVRNFCNIVKGSVFLAGYPTDIKTLKKTIGLCTLSKSLNIGEILENSWKNNSDPLPEVIKASGGRQIFKGQVKRLEKVSKKGFLQGYTSIENAKDILKIYFKNENLIAWLNDKPLITCPDLITVLDSKTGEGIHNTKIVQGLDVTVIGIPALPVWKEKRGLQLLGPQKFGFEITYNPFVV